MTMREGGGGRLGDRCVVMTAPSAALPVLVGRHCPSPATSQDEQNEGVWRSDSNAFVIVTTTKPHSIVYASPDWLGFFAVGPRPALGLCSGGLSRGAQRELEFVDLLLHAPERGHRLRGRRTFPDSTLFPSPVPS